MRRGADSAAHALRHVGRDLPRRNRPACLRPPAAAAAPTAAAEPAESAEPAITPPATTQPAITHAATTLATQARCCARSCWDNVPAHEIECRRHSP